MRRTNTVLLVVFALAVVACGENKDETTPAKEVRPTKAQEPAKPEAIEITTPRAAADALAKAFTDKDAEAAVALLLPAEEIERAFTCADKSMAAIFARKRQDIPGEFAKPKSRGITMKIGAFDRDGSKTETFGKGEMLRTCKVKVPVTLHTSVLTLQITRDGKTKDDKETWRFIKIGDADRWWYYQ